MDSKDKELLYKDLCMRLPYKVRCFCEWKKSHENGTIGFIDELSTYLLDEFELMDEQENIPFKNLKPYLRSMSSMTEKEKSKLDAITVFNGDILTCITGTPQAFDYLLLNHFDFKNLIEKNLAIEVTEENNPYKE